MPITTITTDVQLAAQYRAVDEAGDVVAITPSQGAMSQLTPLAAMELYEQLHAGRNQVRRQAGLAEIATPDEAVLVLAFLRLLREEPAENLREVLQRFDEAARTMQMNRVEEALEQGDEEAADEHDWSVIERIKRQRRGILENMPCAENGQEPAEVT